MIEKVLIVCTGNTARSPVGEYLGKYYAKIHNYNLMFNSAGFINAFDHMQPESVNYLNLRGISSSDFRPKLINKNILIKHDLILTMELSHAIDIKTIYSDIDNINNKVFTLKEFNGEKTDLDINDPYGSNAYYFDEILKVIDENIEKAIQKIIKMNTIV